MDTGQKLPHIYPEEIKISINCKEDSKTDKEIEASNFYIFKKDEIPLATAIPIFSLPLPNFESQGEETKEVFNPIKVNIEGRNSNENLAERLSPNNLQLAGENQPNFDILLPKPNIEIQQPNISFAKDADNGLSYERMNFICSQLHPRNINDLGIIDYILEICEHGLCESAGSYQNYICANNDKSCFDKYGIGVVLYFKQLKYFFALTIVMCLFSVPSFVLYMLSIFIGNNRFLKCQQ